MNFFKKTVYLTLLASLYITSTAQPLGETTAAIITGITGIAIGGGTAYCIMHGSNYAPGGIVAGAAVGGIAGLVSAKIMRNRLVSYTPTGKFAYAQERLAKAHQNTILTNNFATSSALMAYIAATFTDSGSLAIARQELISSAQCLAEAKIALNAAYNEGQNNPANYPDLIQQYQPMLQDIDLSNKKITDFLSCLKFTDILYELAKLQNNQLIKNDFGSPEELAGYISASFGNNWPFVEARKNLFATVQQLTELRAQLITVHETASNSATFYTGNILQEYKPTLQDIDQTSNKIVMLLGSITNNQRYLTEVQLYEQSLEQESLRLKTLIMYQDSKIMQQRLFQESQHLCYTAGRLATTLGNAYVKSNLHH